MERESFLFIFSRAADGARKNKLFLSSFFKELLSQMA